MRYFCGLADDSHFFSRFGLTSLARLLITMRLATTETQKEAFKN